MANLQQTLDALQPYVIGIRYVDKVPVVDAVFKDGWTLPESKTVNKAKGNDEINYYMIYSEKEGIGLDELLGYVDLVIKANIEREKKHELLKERVNELKELFKRNSLTKLNRLKFSFTEDELLPEINDFDISDTSLDTPEINEVKPIANDVIESTPEQELIPVQEPTLQQVPTEELSEEELEMLEEERRAENFRKVQEARKQNGQLKNLSSKVELPPKKKILQSTIDETYDAECECGPEEACSKCIDRKGY